jgi:hypothetical protein
MKTASLLSLITVLLVTTAHADSPPTVAVVSQEPAKAIYHSPQTPGYTAWCTLWREPKGELRVAFQQVTGPADDWSKRKNVTVILGSGDEGATWKKLREVPARTNEGSAGDKIYAAPGSSSFCGHGFAVLKDGALITGLWATGKDKSGFVQRSADDGQTWSPPICVRDPDVYKMYPSQIHQLRDGRVILMAGMVKQADANTAKFLLKEFFESRDGGKTWSHIWTMPKETGLCEESDFVELDNGDLLFIHRAEHYNDNTYVNSDRLQTIFHRKGDAWDIGPTTAVPIPHSGYPELLKLREGPILHIGTDGVWEIGPGLETWTKLNLPGSPYYPRAIQLNDGRVLVVGHVGGDDEYGKVDQTIVGFSFKLNVSAGK